MLRRKLLVGSACMALALPLRAADAGASSSVEIVGAVRQPLRVDAAALERFPAADQASMETTRSIDGTRHSSRVAGVRLSAVLEQAGLAERDRLDWRKSVVVATAADGYRVVFSWPELFNTEAGRQVLLVYRRDGAPLDAREGPLALHAAGDLRSGPRHVRQLERLDVRILSD